MQFNWVPTAESSGEQVIFGDGGMILIILANPQCQWRQVCDPQRQHDRSGSCGGTTAVIQQSNDVANTQQLLRMLRKRGSECDGVSGGDGRGGGL